MEGRSSILGVQRLPAEEVSKYGIVQPDEASNRNTVRVKSLVEKPAVPDAPSDLAIMGRYIIEPEIFDILENTTTGAGGEIQLTDALKVLASQKAMYAHIFEGKRYDVGDKLGFLQATVEFALSRPDLKGPFAEYLQKFIQDRLINEAAASVQ